MLGKEKTESFTKEEQMGWLEEHKRQKDHKFVFYLERTTFNSNNKLNWLNYGVQVQHNIGLQSKFWLVSLAKQFTPVGSKHLI